MWGVGVQQEEAGMLRSCPFTPLYSLRSETEASKQTQTQKNKNPQTTDYGVPPSRVQSQLDRGGDSKLGIAPYAKA